MIDNRQALRVVSGLGTLANADFFQHFIRATAVDPDRYTAAFK